MHHYILYTFILLFSTVNAHGDGTWHMVISSIAMTILVTVLLEIIDLRNTVNLEGLNFYTLGRS